MASGGVNANINIAVKNLQALDRLNKNLEASAKAQQKLVTGLDRVSQRLSKINSQGNVFGKIGRDAGGAVQSIGKLQQSLSKMAGLSKAGGGATGKGIFAGILTSGAAAALTVNGVTKSVNGLIGGLGRSITPTTGVAAALNNMGAALSAHPALWMAASVAAMAFGDKILPATVGTVKAVGRLGQALNKTSQEFVAAKATAIDFNIGIINVKKQMENMVRGASLNEIRTLVNQSKNEMEGFWSMTRGAEQAAIKLAAALKAQKKEQAAIDDLLRAAQGRVRKADLPSKKEAKSAQIAYKAAQWRKKELKLTQDRVALEEKASQQKMKDIAAQEKADRRRLTRARRIRKLEQRRGLAERRGRMGENLMLGAGFPMLFGGGAGAVGGGMLGAGMQGMMGGKGFGAQILLSAIGQQIDAFVVSTSKLGQAMSGLVPDIDALINSMGQAGTAEGIRLKVIEQARGKQAALNAAMKNMTRIIGEKGVKSLQEWGERSQKISESWSRFMLKMGAGFAQLLNWADKFFGLSKAADKGKARDFAATSTDPKIKALFKELRASERASSGSGNWGGGVGSIGKRSVSAIEKDLFGADGTGGLVGAAQEVERQKKLKGLHSDLMNEKQKENKLLKAKLAGNYEEVKLNQEVAAEVKRRSELGIIVNDEMEKTIKSNIEENNKLKKKVEYMEQIKDAWKSINAEITGSIKDGIKGLIKGTATWADMLNNIADKFLDMALNQALYGSILGSGGTKGGGILGALGLFANGGKPPVGKPSIVGEKGPELFVPSSSGKIIPNHELGGGGSVNVTVNVDASGTDVQGDDSQAKQLGTMLSAAVQAELVKQKRPGGLLAGVA